MAGSRAQHVYDVTRLGANFNRIKPSAGWTELHNLATVLARVIFERKRSLSKGCAATSDL